MTKSHKEWMKDEIIKYASEEDDTECGWQAIRSMFEAYCLLFNVFPDTWEEDSFRDEILFSIKKHPLSQEEKDAWENYMHENMY